MKRLIAIIDSLAVSMAMLFLFAAVGAILRSLFIAFSMTDPDTNPDFLHNLLITPKEIAHDVPWGLWALIAFILLWAACRWKEGLAAIEQVQRR
jgi:hypothetical protein